MTNHPATQPGGPPTPGVTTPPSCVSIPPAAPEQRRQQMETARRAPQTPVIEDTA
jgi:hypothetical protein